MALRAPTIDVSFSEAFDRLKGVKDPDVLKTAHPKCSPERQAAEPGAVRIWGTDIWSKGKGRLARAGGLLDIPTKDLPTHASKLKNGVVCFMRGLCLGATHVAFLYYAPRCGRLAFVGGWEGVGGRVAGVRRAGQGGGGRRGDSGRPRRCLGQAPRARAARAGARARAPTCPASSLTPSLPPPPPPPPAPST
jgi:hypothetical protein